MPRLTLNRKAGESITIGNVVVHFDWIGGASVQVVVEAPADVPIHRTELLNDLTCPECKRAECASRPDGTRKAMCQSCIDEMGRRLNSSPPNPQLRRRR